MALAGFRKNILKLFFKVICNCIVCGFNTCHIYCAYKVCFGPDVSDPLDTVKLTFHTVEIFIFIYDTPFYNASCSCVQCQQAQT